MNVNHYEYRRDFTMHTKLSGKVSFTYSDKTNPAKQPPKQYAYIREILQPYASQGSWELMNEREVMIITKGELEMRYYIQKQTDVAPVEHEEEPLDHNSLWVDVPSSSEGTQDDTRGNQASGGHRTHGGARQAPNRGVHAASRHGQMQQYNNASFQTQDNMELLDV